MCGIVGLRRFDGERADPRLLAAMTETLAHRGPDEQGLWCEGPVGLGHRRLRVIGLDTGHQPMTDPTGRFQLSFNGEILNFRELGRQLGLPRPTSDTEVLLHAWGRWGTSALPRLRGQFAFAVHDTVTAQTWLARDRTGILPLHYVLEPALLAFASEVKALLPALPAGPRLDASALPAYLTHRSVPAPRTLFQGVRKVPPGCVLHVDADARETVQRYWEPPRPGTVLDLTPAEAVLTVDERLRQAVRESLVADVPVGAYLSGGLDSSLVVALAAREVAPAPVATFTAGFDDPRVDERPYARHVSRLLGTDHVEVPVRAADFEQLWPLLTWHRDAPVSEPADVAVFRLAQAARERVTVVLSGEGADELFAGYPKYRFAGLTVHAGLLPDRLRAGLVEPLQSALPPRAERLRILLRAQLGATPAARAAAWFAPFTPAECAALLGTPPEEPERIDYRDGVDLLARTDLASWLPDNLLERGDRMSMAASLELRPPFLHPAVVDTALALDGALRVRHGRTKWVLKQVAERYLPPEIAHRPKVGFRVPLDTWFRGDLRDLTHDLLLGPDSFVLSTMDPVRVRRLVRDHESGRRAEQIRLWTLLSLEVWARTFLHSPGHAPARPPAHHPPAGPARTAAG